MNTWLDEHLETFVRPKLGKIPNIDTGAECIKRFTPVTVKCMHAVWKRMTQLAEDRMILLPGRDVWLFKVISGMLDNHPTLFRPEISSCVAKSGLLKDDFSKMHALDTGYSGTVPKSLGVKHWHLLSWGGHIDGFTIPKEPKALAKHKEPHQVFPAFIWTRYCPKSGAVTHKGSPLAGLASHLEGTPKYWERGIVEFKPGSSEWSLNPAAFAIAIKPQILSIDEPTFIKAAMLTRLIAESCLRR